MLDLSRKSELAFLVALLVALLALPVALPPNMCNSGL
jgi:hypothetical protein